MSPRKWEDYLIQKSGLPGPRANYELAKAFARAGTLLDFKKYIFLEPQIAPENNPKGFLVICGVLGLGQYLSKYDDDGLFNRLKELSNDPRRRVRKAVTMALQMIGRNNMPKLLERLKEWMKGSYLEQRCVAVSLSEPDLLRNKQTADEVLHILDFITVSIVAAEPRNEGFRQLKRSLGYCWSVVVPITPRKGRRLMERWIKEDKPNINDIMNENLKRLQKIEPIWTDKQLTKLKW